MSINFVSLDFETANRYRTSACSIGLVKVKDGKVVDSFYSLINPEEHFMDFNTFIHGITNEDVVFSPLYSELIEDILTFIEDLPVVAHNAPFDMSIIKACNEKYHIQTCKMDYFDSCSLARRLMNSTNYKLNTLADMIGFEFTHHNALEDAMAAAQVILHLCSTHTVRSIPELIRAADYTHFGIVEGAYLSGFTKTRKPSSKQLKCI